MRLARAVVALGLLVSGAVAQTLTPPIQLNNPPNISALGGAPNDAHYYTNQAEAGLSAEVVPAANVITLLGSADNAAMRTNLGLTALATTTPAANVATFLATPSSANLNAALTDDVPTLGGANTFTANGALSAPAAALTGTWITGGSATTNKPLVLIEPAGTASTAWNTNGTAIGINAASGCGSTINFVDFQVAAVQKFYVRCDGASIGASYGVTGTSSILNGSLVWIANNAGSLQLGASNDTLLFRDAAATFRLGAADAASPVAQTVNVQDVVAGTSNTAGAALTINGSRGTGTGAGGNIVLGTALPGSTGTAQNSTAAALTINSVAQAPQVNTSTVALLPTCGASQEGAIRGVTDALAPAFVTTIVGGGTVHAPVYCNGSTWIAF